MMMEDSDNTISISNGYYRWRAPSLFYKMLKQFIKLYYNTTGNLNCPVGDQVFCAFFATHRKILIILSVPEYTDRKIRKLTG